MFKCPPWSYTLFWLLLSFFVLYNFSKANKQKYELGISGSSFRHKKSMFKTNLETRVDSGNLDRFGALPPTIDKTISANSIKILKKPCRGGMPKWSKRDNLDNKPIIKPVEHPKDKNSEGYKPKNRGIRIEIEGGNRLDATEKKKVKYMHQQYFGYHVFGWGQQHALWINFME